MRRVRLDITGYRCPMTYVRTRLALEALSPGDALEVVLEGSEPLTNIPRSVAEEGHEVQAVEDLGGGCHRVVIVKGLSASVAPRP